MGFHQENRIYSTIGFNQRKRFSLFSSFLRRHIIVLLKHWVIIVSENGAHTLNILYQ